MRISSWLSGFVGQQGFGRGPQVTRRRVRKDGASRVEALELRELLSATLVKDIKPGTDGAFPPVVNTLGAGATDLFFAVDDGSGTGTELYASNGTAAGTRLVKDILPGAESSTRPAASTQTKSGLGEFFTLGTFTYFAANDGTNGSELWKTDGTAAGTVMVKDINPGAEHSEPSKFAKLDATRFLFYAKTAAAGYELWISDGTDAGTTMVTDILPGTGHGVDPDESPVPVLMGGNAYFTANAGTTGYELWKTDGTAAGTVLVKDVNLGTTGLAMPQFAPEMKAVGSTLYFVAITATEGTELWMTDGTTAGTTIVTDIYPGTDPLVPTSPASSTPTNLTVFGTKLVFAATNSAEGTELWITDGTVAGTTLIKDIYGGATNGVANSSRPTPLGVLGTSLLFAANDGVVGTELWKTDGTTAGTALLMDINNLGASDGVDSFGGSAVFDNEVFFIAETQAQGKELWSSDGTVAGTSIETDINPGTSAFSNVASLTVAGDRFYLIAQTPATGLELFSFTAADRHANVAPTLDTTGNPFAVLGAGARQSAEMLQGTLVSDILARGAGGNPITDPDTNALKGIAITAVDQTLGNFQYTLVTNNPAETDWVNVDAAGAISEANALLLPTTARVRFSTGRIPHHATAPVFLSLESKLDAGITFRAWDQTTGGIGGRASTTANGGSTAFSTAQETTRVYFEVRLFRHFNKNASLNVYTLEAEFNALAAANNPAFEDRSTDAWTGFTVLLSNVPELNTTALYRMYYGVQFNANGTQIDMGYRYLTTNLIEAQALENSGPADKRSQRAGAYFREEGVNNGSGILGYIYTTQQPGTQQMKQIYRTDIVNKPTRPAGTNEGGTPTSFTPQENGDHVYTTNTAFETTKTGTWRVEDARGFVRPLGGSGVLGPAVAAPAVQAAVAAEAPAVVAVAAAGLPTVVPVVGDPAPLSVGLIAIDTGLAAVVVSPVQSGASDEADDADVSIVVSDDDAESVDALFAQIGSQTDLLLAF